MAVDERRRRGLFQAAAQTFGQEHAETMFELFPPSSSELALRSDVVALRADVDGLRADVDGLRADVDGLRAEVDGLRTDVEGLRGRVDALSTIMGERFAAMDQRFDDQHQFLEARLGGLRDELVAAFRGELVTTVAGQTRAVIVAVATATFGIGGLAVTLAQVL